MPFKVRPLDILPYKEGFLLKDPLGISRDIFLNKESLLLLSIITEGESIEDIKVKFLRKTGIILSDSEIIDFLREMDRNYMLYNENFLERVKFEKEKLLSLPFKEINYYFNSDNIKKEIMANENPRVGDVKGILVPHIDVNIGREVYVRSYSLIKSVEKKVFFIFGVPHFYYEFPFSIFPKNYKIGERVISVEVKLIESLKEKFKFDILSDLLAYKNEHSIEFPIIFLSLIKENFSVIPSLVSEAEIEMLKEISEKIFDSIKGRKEEILFISSVDLSHVGRKFGDGRSFDTKEIDLQYLKYLENLENEKAFNFIKEKNNFTRIDGLYANFVFIQILKLMGCKKGEILDYRVYYEKLTDSMVSFASMIFT